MSGERTDTGTPDDRDPFNQKGLDDLATMDPAKLAGMSEKDIEAALGHITPDRSTEARPEGDAPLHDMIRAAEEKERAAAQQPVVETTTTAVQTQAPVTTTAAATAAAAPAAAQTATPATAATPNVDAEDLPYIETSDGKKIPYQVLREVRTESKTYRDRAAALEQELAALRAGQQAPVAQPQAQAPVEPQQELPSVRAYTDEEIEKLNQSFPEAVVSELVTNRNLAVAAYERAERLEASIAGERAAARTMTAQEFIDGDPLARTWFHSQDPAQQLLAEEAIATDELLKTHPVWSKKSDIERMDEAIRRTATVNGIDRPTQAVVASTTAQPSLQARAQAAVTAAAAQPIVPQSHSDLPAGGAPPQSERDQVAGLSTTQLEAQMEKWTPKQIEAYLTRVA